MKGNVSAFCQDVIGFDENSLTTISCLTSAPVTNLLVRILKDSTNSRKRSVYIQIKFYEALAKVAE